VKLSDEILAQTLAASQQYATQGEAAASLGIDIRTLQRRLASIRTSGYSSDIPVGYKLGKVTRLVGPEGVSMEWQHLHPLAAQVDPAEELPEWLNRIEPVVPRDIPPYPQDYDLTTVYAIPDLHLGQHSWGRETGVSYDLTIAESTLRTTVWNLMARSPNSRTAIILNLGDFFHADTDRWETEKSHNRLDGDSRIEKVMHLGVELMIWTIDLALDKHENVIVVNMPGNHDPNLAKALTLALWARYNGHPRVLVDTTPGLVFAWQFGSTMLAAHHGHTIKPAAMPGVMANYWPDMWGTTTYRYALLGHTHHTAKGLIDEHSGAIWEVLPALTAPDAYARGTGNKSLRSMKAITYHAEHGEYVRHTEAIE
jgi:hypothetical protein